MSYQDEAAIVEEGLHAEALLGMPFFQKLLRDISLECAVELLDTKPEQSAQRELIYQKHQGLQAIEASLLAKKAAMETIKAHLEAETAAFTESE